MNVAFRNISIVGILLALVSCNKAQTAEEKEKTTPANPAELVAKSAPTVTPTLPGSANAANKEARVRHLMQLTGAADLGKQVMDGMMSQFKSMPNLPPGFVDKFQAQVSGDDLLELVIPIYMEHLDIKTIEATISFYETPEGKTLVSKQPIIMQESMAVGQKWGQEMAMKIMQDMK